MSTQQWIRQICRPSVLVQRACAAPVAILPLATPPRSGVNCLRKESGGTKNKRGSEQVHFKFLVRLKNKNHSIPWELKKPSAASACAARWAAVGACQTSVREDGELWSAVESGGRAWQTEGQGRGGLSPSQPGAQAAAVPFRRSTFCCSLQEAFADHHPGRKLGVTEWNTALLSLWIPLLSQWKMLWASSETLSQSRRYPVFSYRDIRSFSKCLKREIWSCWK